MLGVIFHLHAFNGLAELPLFSLSVFKLVLVLNLILAMN